MDDVTPNGTCSPSATERTPGKAADALLQLAVKGTALRIPCSPPEMDPGEQQHMIGSKTGSECGGVGEILDQKPGDEQQQHGHRDLTDH